MPTGRLARWTRPVELSAGGLPLASAGGRGVLVATILGSGVAFLDGSVVNVALPTIGRELGGGFTVLQWTVDGYLLTLSALLLLGGALGDRLGRRRIYLIGLIAFTAASLVCGLAPDGLTLVIARVAQGVGGAMLVPGSLALIEASICKEDRGRAIGTWAGLTGVASAVGPFLGGWLVETSSWRWAFFINLPLATAALLVTLASVPESRNESAAGGPDLLGAFTAVLGLAGVVYALIEGPSNGWSAAPVACGVVGALSLVAFVVVEHRTAEPLLPLSMFRSAQFSGANLTTFVVYGALGGAMFLLTLQLQQSMGYSPLDAGLATLPVTILMLLLSSRMGALAQRTGPRVPMTVGPLLTAVGMGLLSLAKPGTSYLAGVLPGNLVFGLGLAITVAPLTSAVLASADPALVGVASGVNNAVARMAGLLAVAVLPVAAGVHTGGTGEALGPGFGRAMLISAALCVAGGVVAWFTIDRDRGRGDRDGPANRQPRALVTGAQAPMTPPPGTVAPDARDASAP
jgi:EmrB/QacA subfamily drug resistance transporter